MRHPTQENLYGYQDGTLDDDLTLRIREHLESCQACARELHFSQQLSESIASVPPEKVRPEFTASVMKAIVPAAEKQQAKSAYPSSGLAAIVLFMVVTLVVVIATGETPVASGDDTILTPYLQIVSNGIKPVTNVFSGIAGGIIATIAASGNSGMARVLGIAFLAILFFAILDKLLIRRIQNPGM